MGRANHPSRNRSGDKSRTADPLAVEAFIQACLNIVPDIHSDTLALFRENAERPTDRKMVEALAELSMEQVTFRGLADIPAGADYDEVEGRLCRRIKARYYGSKT